MFREPITSTPFTSEVAEECLFRYITGDSLFPGDVSFLSTLRAIVAPRMQEGESLKFYARSPSYSAIGMNNPKDVIRTVTPLRGRDSLGCTIIDLVCFSSPHTEDNAAYMDLEKREFCNIYDGFQRVEKVTEFFKDKFNVLCFINQDARYVMLLTDHSMRRSHYHYLQSGICAFLPWYFDAEQGLTEDEMNLIRSLGNKQSESYLQCLEKLGQKYDFYSRFVRKNLAGIQRSFIENQIAKNTNEIADLMTTFKQYNLEIQRIINKKNLKETKILGLRAQLANNDTDTELMDYFLSNKNLSLRRVIGPELTFVAKGYMTFFEEDMALSMIDNKDSYIYHPAEREDADNYIPSEDMELFMRALVSQKIKLRFCAAYTIDLCADSIEGIEHYNYGEFRNYTPNPHIDQYGCLGSHQPVINQFLADKNYIMAIEQCISSCKSLNFGDYAVMDELMLRLYGYNDCVNMRCIELPDGDIVSPIEAIEFLKDEVSSNE